MICTKTILGKAKKFRSQYAARLMLFSGTKIKKQKALHLYDTAIIPQDQDSWN